MSPPSSEASTLVLNHTSKKTRFRFEKLEERIAPSAMVFDTATGHYIVTDSGNIHIINNGGGNNSTYRLVDPITGQVTDTAVELV